KRKFNLVMVIIMMTLLLFGCTEAGQDPSIKDEEIPSKVVEKVENTSSDDEASLDQGNSQETLDNNLKVHFIDVGQGSSVFLVGADGKTMLYDAGGEEESSGRIIVDYIKSIGYE